MSTHHPDQAYLIPNPLRWSSSQLKNFYNMFDPTLRLETREEFSEADGAEKEYVVSKKTVFEGPDFSPKSWMIPVHKGTFVMGNTRSDPEGSPRELPVHPVRITYDYWMGKHPITLQEYLAYLLDTSQKLQPERSWKEWLSFLPAEKMGLIEAIRFCNWLSGSTGIPKAYDHSGRLVDSRGKQTLDLAKVEGYRIPSEAEWEYAARAGHKRHLDLKYSGSNDPKKVAWYDKRARGKTHEVGTKNPNSLGIHDMSGNVWEWCYDGLAPYSDREQENPLVAPAYFPKIVRGGSWLAPLSHCRIPSRFVVRKGAYRFVGFRLCRTMI